jgi:hypothetical protein
MAQIFHPSARVLSRASIIAGVIGVAAFALVAVALYRSSYYTNVNEARPQEVPFSHQHHVAGLGLDCRYCHASVEQSSFAGIPPTTTCMTCHSQVWNTSPMLAPVLRSFQTNTPLTWVRVHDLPDFVYFNHSIHIGKGIGCSTCHGQVDQMPLTWKVNTLYMDWCLDCHRQPEAQIRPREEVFNMAYTPPADQPALGAALVKMYNIRKQQLTDCSICHR